MQPDNRVSGRQNRIDEMMVVCLNRIVGKFFQWKSIPQWTRGKNRNRKEIGMLFQVLRCLTAMTVEQNVMFP
jgi:ABC-type polar amino acid transport system ATPase subunit